MYYSLFLGKQPKFKLDANGNKIKIGEKPDGSPIYEETGQSVETYSAPVLFYGNITFSKVGEATDTEFGFDISSYSAVLVTEKDLCPLTETSLIWYENEPTMASGTVEHKKADYKVVKVSPSINYDKYVLAKVVK